MEITLNGKAYPLSTTTTIEELLNQLQLDCQQVVVEYNQHIIPRQRHGETRLEDGDALEIVHFVGGG